MGQSSHLDRSSLALICGSGVFTALALTRWILDRPSVRLRQLLGANFRVLSAEEREMASRVMLAGQASIFRGWPPAGVNDAAKRSLVRAAADKLSKIGSDVTSERLATLQAPVAEKRAHSITEHGDTRDDPYYWLRDDDRKNADVLAYIKAENDYCKTVLADTEALQETLYSEMRGRIQEADVSVPTRRGAFYYYVRTLEGKQYRVRCRRAVPQGAGAETEESAMDESLKEEVLLDENAEASKHEFYQVGGVAVSDDEKLLAYSEDTKGDEKYSIRVVDIASRSNLLQDTIDGVSGGVVWAADNAHIFYVKQDSKHRPYQVWRHKIGDPVSKAKCIFEEKDEGFFVGVGRSRDLKMIYISCGSSITSDTRYIPADEPTAEFKMILPRVNDVDYDVSHWHGQFFILKRTEKAPNSELLVAPVSAPESARVLLEHRPEVKIMDFAVSEGHLVVLERSSKSGLPECHVFDLPESKKSDEVSLASGDKLVFDEPAYDLWLQGQGDFSSIVLSLGYCSLTTPVTTYAHNMTTSNRVVKKVAPVLGGFDQSVYVTERLWAQSHDGKQVPISLVYNKNFVTPGTPAPLHLDAYGAYEICNDPTFSSNRLSLLDRGIVYAIAHVRGGGDLGRLWYEDGKYLNKKNTFLDVIACAEKLVGDKWTAPEMQTLEGRSAGGMTVGTVMNMRPDLFKGIVMGVPFVDCLTTMLDESIPLTVIEYEEWGNPHKEEYYHYMKSYSPMDNIEAKGYPNVLVTAGLHDPRVAYWEPAKFVAKLRHNKTDSNMLVFKCDMGAGHFSQSGRFDRLKELALDYSFIIKCAGKL